MRVTPWEVFQNQFLATQALTIMLRPIWRVALRDRFFQNPTDNPSKKVTEGDAF
jgi:hypothetical protein